MRVALAGPVRVGQLLPWLDADESQLPAGRGGTPVTQIVRGLLTSGHDVVVASLDHRVTDEVVARGEHLTLRLGHYRPRHRARDAFRVERNYIAESLRRERPTVVHAHWTYEYALGALDSGLPTLVTIRDWAPTILRLSPTPYRAVRLLMNLQTLRRGRHFTVTSPYMQQRFRRWLRWDVPVIPNALEDEVFEPRTRPLSMSAPLLTAVNNGFDRRKNVGTLLEAFARIRQTIPQSRLRLVGASYGPGEAAHKWARERGLEEGVQFLGSVSHERLPSLMQEADVFVHPAREESFGMVLVEAMSQGTPVVAGRRSGAVPWVLDHGRAGVLTDIGSAEVLAETVVGLLTDTARWRHFSCAAYEHAHANFRLSPVLDQYLALYEKLASAGHA